MGSEGVIGSKISSAFEDDFNVFKFDYQLGHDFTKSCPSKFGRFEVEFDWT